MACPVYLTDDSENSINVASGNLPVEVNNTPSVNVANTPSVSVDNSYLSTVPLFDSGVQDAFGRTRVSSPTILFDSKMVNHSHDLLWDDDETSGSGTSATYNVNRSDVKMETTTGTAGTRVLQSFRHFNYHTAKSQLIFMTFTNAGSSTGITKRLGYFHEKDGLFFQSSGGTLSFVTRSYTSGSAVDTVVTQANWNLDKLDGTGASGYTLDPDKGNILVIDFEWLGVGRARFGFVIDGKIIYCHAVNNANNITSVYMRSPNLPARYEIANDGTGTADLYMYAICASISSEGVLDKVGMPYAYGLDSQATLSGTTDTWAMLGLRLKSSYLDTDIIITNFQGYCTSADGILVTVHVNPTINGTPTWADIGDTSLQGFVGDGITLDITDAGAVVYKFAVYGKTDSITIPAGDSPLLGSYIDGTPTELVVGMKALTANPKAMVFASWREV